MKRLFVFIAAVSCLAGAAAHGASKSISLPTAKQAVEVVNAQVPTNTQNQVILIEGTDSDSNLVPRLWDITLFDTNRVNYGLIVRVKDGAVVSKSGSLRLFDDAHWSHFGRNFSGFYREEIINPKRWKLDSDQIVRAVQAHPKLAGLQVTQVVLTLRKVNDGDVPPVWRIKVRARPQQNPKRESWAGFLEYNAETGELLADELRVEGLLK